MIELSENSSRICFGELKHNQSFYFNLLPSKAAKQAISADLGTLEISKLGLKGKISPAGKDAWLLKAQLGATVVQSCVISLEPVRTRIDALVERNFIQDFYCLEARKGDSDGLVIEKDENIDPLDPYVNLFDVLTEALVLELPAYPRVKGVTLKTTTYSGEGVRPISDGDVKPFAGLSILMEKRGK